MNDTKDYLEIKELWIIHNETHIEIVDEFRKAGLTGVEAQEYWTKQMSDWYEELLTDAKEAYYNTGVPIMSDEAFDKLEEMLRYIKPQSELLKQVGSKKR